MRNPHVICYSYTRIQRTHIGPRHHIHRCCAVRVHRHVGKQAVVIEVVVQRHVMLFVGGRQKAIDTRRPTLTRHIHMDGYVWTLRVVHLVSDVVVVGLCLPTRVTKEVLVRQRRNQSLSLRHVHVQGGVAHIGGTIKNQRCLQHVLLRQSKSSICKDVYLLELRELQFVATAHLVVVGMTIESACVDVRSVAAQRRIGTIHLHVAIPFMTNRSAGVKRIVVEARLAQLQIQTATDVARGLRIAVESAVQADALQVSALHVAGHGVHLVRAGIKDFHAVDGR